MLRYVPRIFGFRIHRSAHAKCLEQRERQLITQQQEEQQRMMQQQHK
jgi:hypothetical protein